MSWADSEFEFESESGSQLKSESKGKRRMGNSRNALAAMNANFKRLFIAFPIVCRLFVMVFIAIGVVCLFATWKIKMSYRLFAVIFFVVLRFVHNCVYLECK